MALDRFVYWTTQRPTAEEIGILLEDYLTDAGKVEIQDGRYFATLVGRASNPFKRIAGAHSPEAYERFFEVYVGIDCIDVITRQQDEFTNNVAKGFQELCLRFYDAKDNR